LDKTRDQQTRTQTKMRLVEQINIYLHSCDYSRALDLLRGTAAEFPNDAELSELEKLAHDGVKRNAEANRLITESQELFAQRKSAEAIQLLRKAYELDKRNSLARSILANALVEQAHSVVETDWLEAETLTNQALALNPAHPTAKTILSLIVARKETSSVEDWVARARKLQASSDPFAALAWVAEGLAVHPHDPKLLLIQDEIQRDQDARRRLARRGDLEDLRRLQREIDGATDVAAKQALAVRIQTIAANYWTDGEILSIANALLLRLGLVSKENSGASPRGKSATVILHVPRPSAPEASRDSTREIPASQIMPSAVPPGPVLPQTAPTTNVPSSAVTAQIVPTVTDQSSKVQISTVPPSKVPPSVVPPSEVRPRKASPSIAPVSLVLTTPPQATTPPAAEPFGTPAKIDSPPSRPKQAASPNSTRLVLISAAAIILTAIIMVAATFFFARKHYASPGAQTQPSAPTVPAPDVPAPAQATSPQTASEPTNPAPAAPTQTSPESSPPAVRTSSDSPAGKVAPEVTPEATPEDHAPVESGHNLGALLVVTGQDDVRVFLDGKLQRQLTQGGQLRLPNLELKDYVVQVAKSGFQDPPQQKIRIRKGEEARLLFNLQPQPQPAPLANLQPQPRLASLTIQGGTPGTAVLVDQTVVGTIHPDGTLSVSTVNPGDHTVELRNERFKPRQLNKHFEVGGTISLTAADAALEATSGELKITFTPADANVAIVKGNLLKTVSSGVPLSLAPGTYTLTARTAERFTRSSTLEVISGQSKTLDLSLAPSGMSNWDDPAAWKREGDSFTRKGGDFVLYKVVPASGTFIFSAMLTKGRLLQWVLNYSDPKNYVLFQIDENNFYRSLIRNGQKTDEIIVPNKGDKKSFRTLLIRVSPTELVNQIKNGDSVTVLDRWTQPGANLSLGKFGFYIPGNDEVALSSFAHYGDLNIH
jgi:tetratricopeptide (TPR) repeat protein